MSAHRPKPTVPEVLPLVQALYQRHAAGCCLHIVLDDGNVSASSVAHVLAFARDTGHQDCIEIAGLLGLMSTSQRRRLYEAPNL
jgi:hypothetical protein